MKRVAIQGIGGSYSEEAVREIFGIEAMIIECTDFASTFAAVKDGTADNAVVPLKNKIVGDVREAVDLFNAGEFRILERLPLTVRHVLAGTVDSKFERVLSVRSHVEALRQCKRFFEANAHLAQVIGSDTASSVRRIVEEENAANAAISSKRAAELYGAKILRENIADDMDNWTTFYVIGN